STPVDDFVDLCLSRGGIRIRQGDIAIGRYQRQFGLIQQRSQSTFAFPVTEIFSERFISVEAEAAQIFDGLISILGFVAPGDSCMPDFQTPCGSLSVRSGNSWCVEQESAEPEACSFAERPAIISPCCGSYFIHKLHMRGLIFFRQPIDDVSRRQSSAALVAI